MSRRGPTCHRSARCARPGTADARTLARPRTRGSREDGSPREGRGVGGDGSPRERPLRRAAIRGSGMRRRHATPDRFAGQALGRCKSPAGCKSP